jgi:hypothetical protein
MQQPNPSSRIEEIDHACRLASLSRHTFARHADLACKDVSAGSWPASDVNLQAVGLLPMWMMILSRAPLMILVFDP